MLVLLMELTMCCNFFRLAGIHSDVSICSSSLVWMLLKSVPEVVSSDGNEFEIEAIAIKINSKHNIDFICLHISTALHHYIQWK